MSVRARVHRRLAPGGVCCLRAVPVQLTPNVSRATLRVATP
ncbi:hypothetical protein TOK_1060 [Pseudonocardia sp. N23]|nr:hypothetical protein TOK_1060 [Pseudonocardia sp. N23]